MVGAIGKPVNLSRELNLPGSESEWVTKSISLIMSRWVNAGSDGFTGVSRRSGVSILTYIIRLTVVSRPVRCWVPTRYGQARSKQLVV